jgi:uncharacterized protein
MRAVIPRWLLALPVVALAALALPAALAGQEATATVPTEATPAALSPDEPSAEGGASVVESAPEIPGLGTAASGWVVDDAGILPGDVLAELNRRLADHQAVTSNQVVVLTLPSLDGRPVEDVAIEEANRRKIGQKGKDNGVLFLVAPYDREVRIEVGYGLEATLPDVLAGRILRKTVVPRFREDDLAGGVVAGVDAILEVLEGRYEPSLAERLPFLERLLAWRDSWQPLSRGDQIFFGIFLFVFGPVVSLLAFAWLPWKKVAFGIGLGFFVAVAALVVSKYPWMLGALGVFAGLAALAWISNKMGWNRSTATGGGGGGRARGGGSSYSSSSSSGSSRSFSGGGGSFGGGGASSRW